MTPEVSDVTDSVAASADITVSFPFSSINAPRPDLLILLIISVSESSLEIFTVVPSEKVITPVFCPI